MDIFYGVDGTGPDDNNTYATDFSSSHVRTLWKNWHTPAAGYIRGPSLAGTETADRMWKGLSWVKEQWEQAQKNANPAKPNRIFLSGYSRGGAAVIALAYHLDKADIPVHAMLLFDAVDRSPLLFTDTIPKNVAACYHALRDPKAGSRESFGNCGRKHAASVAYTEKHFYCTHGGVGGCPWKENGKSGKIEEMDNSTKAAAIVLMGQPAANIHDFTNVTVAQDQQGSQASWTWMSQNLTVARASREAEGIAPFGIYGKTRE
ncbi:hypothetical protein [Yoonia sp. SS1-5]|uniref:Uncharacterized protein n=1 Tax=Yoonia rhodophyticola TaxID=3137370 RepID=A0AAN0NJ92_9RHOB